MTRPTWGKYFMNMAIAASTRSTCPRASVGAVLVKWDKYYVTSGFNGAKSGDPHCVDVGCDLVDGHCKRAVHAEANAIDIAKNILGIKRLSTMSIYCTHAPCVACAQLIFDNGINKVFYLNAYMPTDGIDYLDELSIQVERIIL